MRQHFIDPLSAIAARCEAGRETAAEVRTAASRAPLAHRKELTALAHRLELCNSDENQWLAPNTPSSFTKGSFTPVGRLWRCNSKLCPDCVAKKAAENRRSLRTAIAAQKKRLGHRYYFATFTIPNPGLSLLETRSIVDRAWTLFRKRSLCVSLIRGGAKSEEFTVTPNGFHYHLHVLWHSKFLHFNSVRAVWTDCVEQAFTDHERRDLFTVNNSDKMLQVVIKPVEPNERCVQELSKYITKSNSWKKLREKDLYEIAMIRRWCRMFEVFGSFREALPPIVHTPSLSDGGSEPSQPTHWRDRANSDLEFYLWRLETEFDKATANNAAEIQRRYPTFTRYSCTKTVA